MTQVYNIDGNQPYFKMPNLSVYSNETNCKLTAVYDSLSALSFTEYDEYYYFNVSMRAWYNL